MTTTPLVAYHGDQKLKQATLRKVRAHQKHDRIVQRTYWTEGDDGVFRGCAVGCLLQDPEGGHERYETQFGIPIQLAWLEDGIFEALPAAVATGWPARFLAAIKPGTDLAPVWPRVAAWMLTDPTHGLEHLTEADDVKAVCRQVAAGYLRMAEGETLTEAEQETIPQAARTAWDARNAWDAWNARNARNAWNAFVAASADKLIELLAAA